MPSRTLPRPMHCDLPSTAHFCFLHTQDMRTIRTMGSVDELRARRGRCHIGCDNDELGIRAVVSSPATTAGCCARNFSLNDAAAPLLGAHPPAPRLPLQATAAPLVRRELLLQLLDGLADVVLPGRQLGASAALAAQARPWARRLPLAATVACVCLALDASMDCATCPVPCALPSSSEKCRSRPSPPSWRPVGART